MGFELMSDHYESDALTTTPSKKIRDKRLLCAVLLHELCTTEACGGWGVGVTNNI